MGHSGEGYFFKREDFIKLGGFDEQYPFNIDDYDLSARLYINGYSVYVNTNVHCLYHGIESRTDPAYLIWKNKYAFAGYSRMVIKNYSFKNLLIWLPLSQLWITYKSFALICKTGSIKPLLSHFVSMYSLSDLRDTLRNRKIIQSKRKIKRSIFKY